MAEYFFFLTILAVLAQFGIFYHEATRNHGRTA